MGIFSLILGKFVDFESREENVLGISQRYDTRHISLRHSFYVHKEENTFFALFKLFLLLLALLLLILTKCLLLRVILKIFYKD